MRGVARFAASVALFGGCGTPQELPDGAPPDLGVPLDLALGETAAPVFAQLTFAGCAKLDLAGDRPRCTGPAPLVVQLVPIVPPGVDSWLWTTKGGEPASSKGASPEVRWSDPGAYTVTVVVGGPSGMATASGDVVVTAAPLGGSCREDRQCGSNVCLCGAVPDGGVTDGGAGCPGALADGLCTRNCAGVGCGPGEVCADLSRSAAKDAQVGAVPWRHPICLPQCTTAADCRPGFSCIQAPALPPGGAAGGEFTWRKACFADVLGAIGAPCTDADGKLAPTGCISGECAPLGVRGLCTIDCGLAACPPEAACAAFTADPTHPLCIARCDMARPCGDPLLACQPALPGGSLGFTVPQNEPMGATYCAPKRCTDPKDCAPAGSCSGPDGGAFCQP